MADVESTLLPNTGHVLHCWCKSKKSCPLCHGKGYIDRWVPFDLLKQLKGWVILARRYRTDEPASWSFAPFSRKSRSSLWH